MTENQWWSTKIQPRWHNPTAGWVARKVQDLVNKGAPDVDACFNGAAVKIELKYCPTRHKDPGHIYTFSTYAKKTSDPDLKKPRASMVSREQYRNLEEWSKANGLAYVLVGIQDTWYLISFDQLSNEGMTEPQLLGAADISGVNRELDEVPNFFADGGYVR